MAIKRQLYYSSVGSFDGAIKIDGRWVRAVELNRIVKTGWERWNGPPSAAIARAMREQPPTQASDLFPYLADLFNDRERRRAINWNKGH